jgi:autotransporter-associated beta strand protein
MKLYHVLLAGTLLLTSMSEVQARQLAFPGAAGWGRFAVGGRYGSIYHVTNLNDSGTGSLREAVSASNRIIVFDVSGVIRISSRMVFSSNLYVAGQTAPGEGIIVYGDGVSFSSASNIIVRYMRFRMGKGGTSGKDCAGVANGTNMIFDHCSFSWGLDETFSINPDNKGDLHSITLSNCVIGQGLLTHSAGGLIQADSITLYRNLYCDNSTRNNKIKGINQYVNNVVYDWNNGCYLMGGDSEGSSYVNTTNNLFINGPAGGGNAITSGNSDFHIYAEDNWQDRDRDGVFNPYEIPHDEYSGGPTFASTPYDYPVLPVCKAVQLVDSILPTVGASLPYRDQADCYMVHEVKSFGTEGAILSNEGQTPIGAPTAWGVKSFTKPVDTDGDGIPDAWETAHGTNPAVNDAMTIAANGYVNIENYVNSLSAANRSLFLRQPVSFSLTESTDSSLVLGWYDFTEAEDGFVLEQAVNDTYQEVAKIPANTETYAVKSLLPGSTFKFRLRAYKGDIYSDYSTELTAKTQPAYVEMVDCANYQPDYTWSGMGTAWDKVSSSWTGKTNLYTDGSKVLFSASSPSSVAVNLVDSVRPHSVVVDGTGDVTFSGSGVIAGEGSVNKTGTGTLTLNADNAYRGATVLHRGTISFSSLKNGGVSSSIGASDEFAQAWIWDGGIWNYTGPATSTNRSAKLYNSTQLTIANPVTVAVSGDIEGTGNFTLSGSGTLSPSSPSFFQYDGNTILRSGTLYLSYLNSITDKKVYLGNGSNISPKLVLAGGSLVTKDANDNYCTYLFPIEVAAGTTSTVSFYRNCYLNNTVTGYGTLEYKVNYVRESIKGDWNGFYGTVIANGVNTSTDGSQFLFDNSDGIPNASIYTKGNTRIVYWETTGALHLGGLSGDAGTFLSCASKKTDNTTMTWYVGGANTDETFNGVIDNRCSASGHNGITSIVKEGSGDWRLTGANIYKGTTTVNDGNLIVNGTNSGTGVYLVNSGATLSGKGLISGKVTVSEGGTLYAGDTIIGAANVLRLAGGCVVDKGTVEIPLTSSSNSHIQVAGAFTVNNGTLSLNMDSVKTSIPDDTAFTLFNNISFATVSGTGFTTIIPATPSETQKWDTSKLLTTGVIYVRSNNWVDGINSVKADAKNSPVYDVNGIRVNTLHHRYYIQNGKKFVSKEK